MKLSPPVTRRRPPVWVLLLILPIACTLLGAPPQEQVPVHGWQKARGPVVPHDSFPDDCRLCHQGNDWQSLRSDFRFDHAEQTGVPLLGRHAEAECLRCHNDRGPVRAFAARGCAGCHEDWHRGKLGMNCDACHDENDWQPRGMVSAHALTRFPLIGAHAGVPCWACHEGAESGVFQKQPTECLSCHAEDLAAAREPDHLANGWTRDCQRCHGTTSWKRSGFVHDFFPLTGGHAAATCEQCHAGARFQGTPSDCASCHMEAWAKVTSPDHKNAGFSTRCDDCHSTAGWKGAEFKHHWPLTGAHTLASCEDCHQGGTYTNAKTDCWSCHEADYNGARDPDHRNASFPTDCRRCHTDRGWTGADFRHEWPLVGQHADASCGACHKTQDYKIAATTCYDCHRGEYEASTAPDHRAARFSTRCEDCHQPSGWKGGDFVHNWPLAGAHKLASCESCHAGRVFQGTTTDCWSCHKLAFESVREPDHVKADFPKDCRTCHNESGWAGANFVHAWPLLGAHRAAECRDCHQGDIWKGTPKDCYACHRLDYEAAKDPDHKKANFPQDCERCHNSVGWKGANFIHQWPLTGVHKTATCDACHKGGVYQGTPKDCYTCHRLEWDSTSEPNHKAANFPTTCETCHNTTTFQGAGYQHRWPLSGAHKAAGCNDCHKGNRYQGLSPECFSCHEQDYGTTHDPDHRAALFPTDCERCHGTSSYKGASYAHQWPLTGAHKAMRCEPCHAGGVYQGTAKDCYSCHRMAYESVKDPDHKAANFPTTCDTCHTTTSFKGATFTHNWALTGAHKAATCNKCHANNVFKGTPKDCWSCHRADYLATTSPNHNALSYPTSCETCHTTTTFKGGSFNHTFRLSGKHNVSCTICHTTPTNYKVVNCLSCHEHRQSEMDDKHKKVTGYAYNSAACIKCHPRGGD